MEKFRMDRVQQLVELELANFVSNDDRQADGIR